MPFAPGNEVASNLSAVGLAHEPTFNTQTAPSQFSPFNQLALIPDPGLFFPATMMGVRESEVFALFGQEKITGALDAPLFPLNGILAWIAGLGNDAWQSGSSIAAKNGTLLAANAGATTLTYTSVTGGAPVANTTILQIGPASNGTFGSAALGTAVAPSFVTTPTNVTGTTSPYTLTVPAIPYAIVTSGPGKNNIAQACQAPFFHGINPNPVTVANGASTNTGTATNRMISLTVEKNLGGLQSEVYTGSMVNSINLKLPTTNAEASFSADFLSAGVAILSTPTTVAGIDAEVPFVFAEGALQIVPASGGAAVTVTTVSNINVTLNNTVKDTYTVTNSHLPTFVTPTTRTISGQLTAVFYSLNDSTYGYFQQAFPSTATAGAPVQGALNLTLTHPGTNGSFNIALPQINIAKLVDEVRIGEVIMQTLDFKASYQLSSASSISSYFSNNVTSSAY